MDNFTTLRAVPRWAAVSSTVLLSTVFLTACSGSSGSDSAQPQPATPTPQAPVATATLSGTAAIGAGISAGTVTAVCADGSSFTEAVTTDSNGRWSGEVANGAMPCALRVSGGTPPVTLHSYVSTAGTVNITPLTDLILASATGQNPADWFAGFSGTTVDTSSASDTLLQSFAAKGFTIPASGNPMTTPFAADGTGWDGLLDDIAEAIADDPAIADYEALMTLVKDGNLASLPNPPLAAMFSISGTVSGATGNVSWETRVAGSMVLDGADTNGAVTFSPVAGISEGSSWSVVITAAPAGQTCEVSDGSGTLSADVTDVSISCADTVTAPLSYRIGGTISGASASVGWEVTRNGAVVASGSNNNGSVTFSATMASDSAWALEISAAPAGQTCTVSQGSGVLTADVDDIVISCSDIVVAPLTHSIAGTIAGASGQVGWALSRNGSAFSSGNSGNGSVSFSAAMESGSVWAVTLTAEPAGQTCAISNASGTLSANVSNVLVNCSDDVVVPPVNGTPLYDFSGLNLDPEVPAGFTPIAPDVLALNPADSIAYLYQQLGEQQRAAAFAEPPADLMVSVSEVVTSSAFYQIVETTAANTWTRLTRTSFGGDNVPDTGDDYIMAYTIYPYGTLGVGYSFTHPGADQQWYTDDDIAGVHGGGNPVIVPQNSVIEFEGASEGAILIIPCLSPGSDNQPFTSDDAPGCSLGYQIAVLDGEGNRGQVISYNGAGSDGLWFTADDRVNNYTLVSTDLSIPQTVTVVYNASGADGLWFTSDDQVQMHIQQLLGDNYQPLYAAQYNQKGADNTWFTSDDNISAYSYYGYHSDGQLLIVANHTSKGTDGQWFTADDWASATIALKDDNGYPLIDALISGNGAMGPDGRWLSGDESIYGYTYRRYNDEGVQILLAQMQAKGADNLWFTSDDVPGPYNYWQREVDATGRVTAQRNYNPALNPSAAAFDLSHLDRYTVYAPDFSTSVSVGRADFGADGQPFTADDTLAWPYTVATANGYNQYNQPGADARWFTADDVRSGYVTQTFDGSRLTLEERFDDNGTLLGYTGYSLINPTSYRLDEYVSDNNGGFTLSYYRIIEEDSNGYPLFTTWYNSNDEVTNVDYTERNAAGLITRQGWSYAAGADGIWGSDDDFSYYSISQYNGAGELSLSASEYRGNDGEWGTDDDSYYISAIYLLDNGPEVLAQNNGYAPAACDDLTAGSGLIRVAVVDENGAPLPGAIVQLNHDGATATTDASGAAEFTSLSGHQDVHVFGNGYGFESFYCVAPGTDVTLHAQLDAIGVAAARSKVLFTNSVYSNFMLVLLDDNGRPLNEYERFSSAEYLVRGTYADLFFNLPPDTEVTGHLWAFRVDNGVMTGAEDLGEQTFTTIAVTANPSAAQREQLAISFSDTLQTAVANDAPVTSPATDFVNSLVSLGGYFGAGFRYDYSTYNYSARLPDDSTALPQADLSRMAYSETWEYWLPGSPLERDATPLTEEIRTGIAYRPLIADQADSSATPQIGWTGVRDINDGYSDITTLTLHSAAGGVGYEIHGTIHLPAGATSVQLPALPAGITGTLLPESYYQMVLESRAFPALGYQEALSLNLHRLPDNLETEAIRTSANEFGAAQLQR